jgi:threonine/homoserine/homoserine lactone efflux protein
VIAYFVQGLTLGVSAGATPGPFQAYLLARTLKNGWRRTLPVALAPLLSDGPIIALVLIVLTRLPGWFLQAMRIGGGLFLIYLAVMAYRTFRAMGTDAEPEAGDAGQSLLEAALINALSPGPWIFWSTVNGPLLVQGWRENPSHAGAFLLAFYGFMITMNATLIVLFGTARRLGQRVTRILTGISAAALLALGVYQLGRGIVELI